MLPGGDQTSATGVVRDAGTEQPLAGIRVSIGISGIGGYSPIAEGFTSARGRFHLEADPRYRDLLHLYTNSLGVMQSGCYDQRYSQHMEVLRRGRPNHMSVGLPRNPHYDPATSGSPLYCIDYGNPAGSGAH